MSSVGRAYAMRGLKMATGGAAVATTAYVFGMHDPIVRRQLYLFSRLAKPLLWYKFEEWKMKDAPEEEKKLLFDEMNQVYGPIFSETLDEMRGFYFNLAEIAWKPNERSFSMRRSYSMKRARSTLADGSKLIYSKCGRGANIDAKGEYLVFTNSPGDDEDWCAAGIRPKTSDHRLGMVGAQVAWIMDNTDEIKYQSLIRGGLGQALEGIDYGDGKKFSKVEATAVDGEWTFKFPLKEVLNIVDNAEDCELVWACGDGDTIGPHAHHSRGKQFVPTSRK